MAEGKVLKIETPTGRPFRLSHQFQWTKSLVENAVAVSGFNNYIATLPLTPGLYSDLEAKLIRRSIHGTAAIEGNPLTEEEVGGVLDREAAERSEDRPTREIQNLQLAYFRLDRQTVPLEQGSAAVLTERYIKDTHYDLTDGIEDNFNQPGYYRNHEVEVGTRNHGGVYRPHKALVDVKVLMSAYIKWINCDDVLSLVPPIRAALAHYHLAMIHPFGDGNGRLARLIEALILMQWGVPFLPFELSNWYYRNQDEYFRVFNDTRRQKDHSVTPFIEFALRGMAESADFIWQRVSGYIHFAVWNEYLHFLHHKVKAITTRQFDLLINLLEMPEDYTFSASSLSADHRFAPLYRRVTLKTTQRDLRKLEKMGLLDRNNKGRLRFHRDHLDWTKTGALPGGYGDTKSQPSLFSDL